MSVATSCESRHLVTDRVVSDAPPPTSRPRVLLAANSSWNIVNFRGGLVRALQQRGYEVLAAAPVDAHTPRLAEIDCRHLPLPMDSKGSSPIADAAVFARFLGLLRREKPAAFLGFTVKPNVYGSLAAHALGVPVINNISGLGTAFIEATALTRIVKRLYRLALRRSKIVYFQNSDDRELFIRGRFVRPQQTALLPGSGVDLKRFEPIPVRDPARPDIRFLLVARLLWDKGIGEYVEAARHVRKVYPAARFQILGFLGAENRTAVAAEVVDSWVKEGLIEYLGHSDDVRPYIADADCIVLPSYREGTSRTLLEAAAMGKPLIATDVPGCREVVDHGGNGLLCTVRDASSLAGRMLEMAEMPLAQRHAMGLASRYKAEQEFDETLVVGRYLSALESLLMTERNARLA